MKLHIFLVLGWVSVVAMTTHAADLVTITNRFESRTWICHVKDTELERAPKWDRALSPENPPCPIGKAMRLAEEYVTVLADDDSLNMRVRARAVGATLQSVGFLGWIYIVKVAVGRPGSNYGPAMQIVVLMDGAIPEFTKVGSTSVGSTSSNHRW